VITNDARCTLESTSRIATAKAEFSRKKDSLHQQIGLKFKEELVKCYSWSRAFYGAESWPLRKVDQKYMGSFKCGAGDG
jgi:hypothetical protein